MAQGGDSELTPERTHWSERAGQSLGQSRLLTDCVNGGAREDVLYLTYHVLSKSGSLETALHLADNMLVSTISLEEKSDLYENLLFLSVVFVHRFFISLFFASPLVSSHSV